jgi:hypothetical protein
MFLTASRRILEAAGSDVFINSTAISSTISSPGADGFFVNSSYNASGEGMVDFGEGEFGECLLFYFMKYFVCFMQSCLWCVC